MKSFITKAITGFRKHIFDTNSSQIATMHGIETDDPFEVVDKFKEIPSLSWAFDENLGFSEHLFNNYNVNDLYMWNFNIEHSAMGSVNTEGVRRNLNYSKYFKNNITMEDVIDVIAEDDVTFDILSRYDPLFPFKDINEVLVVKLINWYKAGDINNIKPFCLE